MFAYIKTITARSIAAIKSLFGKSVAATKKATKTTATVVWSAYVRVLDVASAVVRVALKFFLNTLVTLVIVVLAINMAVVYGQVISLLGLMALVGLVVCVACIEAATALGIRSVTRFLRGSEDEVGTEEEEEYTTYEEDLVANDVIEVSRRGVQDVADVPVKDRKKVARRNAKRAQLAAMIG